MARTRKTKTWHDLVPTSKAKTAYGLLSDIAKLSLAEPKRMRMDVWGGYRGNWRGLKSSPKCGTVGCIGGWTKVLRPRNAAHETLGLTENQVDELFYGPLSYSLYSGTPDHARRVARLIAGFQKKYRAQLLAKRV